MQTQLFLDRGDLYPSKAYSLISEISINDFDVSAAQIENADAIFFRENDRTEIVLKTNDPDPTWQDFKEVMDLERGQLVRHKGTSTKTYVVTSNYGSRATAVNTVDITNPSEWEVFKT